MSAPTPQFRVGTAHAPSDSDPWHPTLNAAIAAALAQDASYAPGPQGVWDDQGHIVAFAWDGRVFLPHDNTAGEVAP